MPLTPDDVFIPGGLPESTYVARGHLELESKLDRWLARRQKPLLSVAGPTKSGKTVLLKKAIPDAMWFSGGAIDTAEDFWEAVCEELEVFTEHSLAASAEHADSTSGGGGLRAVIEAGVTGTRSDVSSRGVTRSRNVSARTAARRALRAQSRIVIIDDFHYVPADEQTTIVRGLKELIFDGLGVVVAVVPHRAYDVVRVEREMTGRVEPLEVPLWEQEDLVLIAQQGFQSLNLEDIRSELSIRLSDESFGSPHLMQTHCLNLCDDNSMGGAIRSPLEAPEWGSFFSSHASSTSKTAFDVLKRGPRQRSDRIVRELNSGIKTDIYGAVLTAIESTGPRTSLTYEEIRGALRTVLRSDLPQRHEITNVLDQMTNIARDSIEGELVLEYDGELSTLYLADPFFAYYLRWAPPTLKDIAVEER